MVLKWDSACLQGTSETIAHLKKLNVADEIESLSNQPKSLLPIPIQKTEFSDETEQLGRSQRPEEGCETGFQRHRGIDLLAQQEKLMKPC